MSSMFKWTLVIFEDEEESLAGYDMQNNDLSHEEEEVALKVCLFCDVLIKLNLYDP